MKKSIKSKNVKINISLDNEFYELIKEKASNDYMRVATWTKQFLMKNLLDKNNDDIKCLTKNGTTMGI